MRVELHTTQQVDWSYRSELPRRSTAGQPAVWELPDFSGPTVQILVPRVNGRIIEAQIDCEIVMGGRRVPYHPNGYTGIVIGGGQAMTYAEWIQSLMEEA